MTTDLKLSMAGCTASLGRFLLRRAFWILGWFTLAVFLVMPPMTSEVHRSTPPPNLLPASILLVIGCLIWVATFVTCERAFSRSKQPPSVAVSLVFFVLFGCELYALSVVVRAG